MPDWTLQQAARLLRRETFGFTASQLRQALADGPQKTVDCLRLQPPDYADFEQAMATLTPREPAPGQTAQLQLYRVLNSPWPQHEKAELCRPPDRRTVKTPLEFALNLAIPLNVQLSPAQLLPQLLALGQRFPDPVERRWLNAYTIVGRSNLATSILAKVTEFPDRRTLIDTLLQHDKPSLAGLDGRDLVQVIANLPEFQLL